MGRDVVLVCSVFINVQHKTGRQRVERGGRSMGKSHERRSG